MKPRFTFAEEKEFMMKHTHAHGQELLDMYPIYKPTFELHKACEKNDFKGAVLALLDGAMPNYVNVDVSGTSLQEACRHNNVALIRLLLKAGALPDENGKKSCLSPLMVAVMNGHQEVCEVLLDEGGADINYEDDNLQYSALSVAIEYGHLSMCKFLRDRGALEPVMKQCTRCKKSFKVPANMRGDCFDCLFKH